MTLEYNSTTTLNRIRKAEPCADGWGKLLSHLGKTKADNEPLNLLTVLDSNGLDDALWVLSCAMPDYRLARHFQAWCAEQVLHIYESGCQNDSRIRDQIAMLRNDNATDDERAAAAGAAVEAASAARDAVWAAERDAVWAAAGTAARDAAWDAVWAAARDAAWGAVWAAQEKQLRKMLMQEAAQ